MIQSVYKLNHEALREKILLSGFKQDYLASKLCISRTSLNRWLSGKTRGIRRDNLEALSKILACKMEDLIETNSSYESVRYDKKHLFHLISDSDTLGRLMSAGKFELIEAVILNTIDDDLASHEHYERLYLLSVCYHKQRKYRKAYECLKDFDHTTNLSNEIMVKSKQYLAMNYLYRSQREKAYDIFCDLFQNISCDLSERTRYILHSNFGYVLYSIEKFEDAIEEFEQSLSYIHQKKLSATDRHCLLSTHRNILECHIQLGNVVAGKKSMLIIEELNSSAQDRYVSYRLALSKLALNVKTQADKISTKDFESIKNEYDDVYDSFYFQYLFDFLNQPSEIYQAIRELKNTPISRVGSEMKKRPIYDLKRNKNSLPTKVDSEVMRL